MTTAAGPADEPVGTAHSAYPDAGLDRGAAQRAGGSLTLTTGIVAMVVALFLANPLPWIGAAIVITALFWSVPAMRRHAPIVARVVLPLLIGRLCVAVYFALHQSPALAPYVVHLAFDEALKEQFYDALATLYAIITALALVKGIEDFDGLRKIYAEEANRVYMLLDSIRYFENNGSTRTARAITEIRALLFDYTTNVAGRRDIGTRGPNARILNKCQDLVRDFECRDRDDEAALPEIMRELKELKVCRAARLGSIGNRIPAYLIAALWIMSAVLIIPFMAQAPAAGVVSYKLVYMIFVMGTLYSFLLIMLSDISSPYDGFWKVDMQVFETLRNEIRPEIDAQPEAVEGAPHA